MPGAARAWVLAAMAAAMAVVAAPVAAAPMRIVSANLCADRLVLRLAPRERIVSVSHLARDPALSPVAAAAAGLHANRGGAEEILALHPDLVLLGPFAPRGGAALLRRLGMAVHEVPLAQDFAGADAAIRDLAARLGVAERGAALVASLEARLDALPVATPQMRAVSLHAGGWVAGAGTPADAVLRRLGLSNAPAVSGAIGYRRLDVEAVLALAPGLIAVERAQAPGASAAETLLGHPALRATAARHVDVPARAWACPDDGLADAAAIIAEAAR